MSTLVAPATSVSIRSPARVVTTDRLWLHSQRWDLTFLIGSAQVTRPRWYSSHFKASQPCPATASP